MRHLNQHAPSTAAPRAIAVHFPSRILEKLERPALSLPALFRADSGSPSDANANAEAAAVAEKNKRFNQNKDQAEAKFGELVRALRKAGKNLDALTILAKDIEYYVVKYSRRGDIRNPALASLETLHEELRDTEMPTWSDWYTGRVEDKNSIRTRLNDVESGDLHGIGGIIAAVNGLILLIRKANKDDAGELRGWYSDFHSKRRQIRGEIFAKFMYYEVGDAINVPFKTTGAMIATAGIAGFGIWLCGTAANLLRFGLSFEDSAKTSLKTIFKAFPAIVNSCWGALMAHPIGMLTGIIAATSIYKIAEMPLAHAAIGEGFWKNFKGKQIWNKIWTFPLKLAVGIAALGTVNAIWGDSFSFFLKFKPTADALKPTFNALAKLVTENLYTAGFIAATVAIIAFGIRHIANKQKEGKERAEHEKRKALVDFAENYLRSDVEGNYDAETVDFKRLTIMSEIASGAYDAYVVRSGCAFAVNSAGQTAIMNRIYDIWPD
jgi:hypothetical protein